MGKAAVTMSAQASYVLVERAPGAEIVLDEQTVMLKELSTFCADVDMRKVLLVGKDVKINLRALDIHTLGKEIAKLHLQIAVVESHDASDEDVRFLENVSTNRGARHANPFVRISSPSSCRSAPKVLQCRAEIARSPAAIRRRGRPGRRRRTSEWVG